MLWQQRVIKVLTILVLGKLLLLSPLHGALAQDITAEAVLPVRAEIVRCVSQEERRTMCRARDLCCNLIDEGGEEVAVLRTQNEDTRSGTTPVPFE